METVETRLNTVKWSELELAAVIAGAVLVTEFLPDHKIWKKHYVSNPEWFRDGRHGAPFMIRWAGGIKAVSALYLSTYTTNPWVKLILMGIAFQGTLQQVRVLTWDAKKNQQRFNTIGDATQLDAQLKNLAEKYRTQGPEYIEGFRELGDRYTTQVAGTEIQADRYSTQVAGAEDMIYDEDEVFATRPQHHTRGAYSFQDFTDTAAA